MLTIPLSRTPIHRLRTELYEQVLPFWLDHSIDEKNGGFFTCLDRNGSRYDDRKHVWLQGRQIWMMSKIFNTVSDDDLTTWSGGRLSRKKLLKSAVDGMRFLREHAFRSTEPHNLYFCLAADGSP